MKQRKQEAFQTDDDTNRIRSSPTLLGHTVGQTESVVDPTTTVEPTTGYTSMTLHESHVTATSARMAAVSTPGSTALMSPSVQFSPVGAVYANAILFPDTDPSWYNDSNTPPHGLEVITDQVEVDQEINVLYTCMAYTAFISLLFVILLLGIAGFYLGASATKSAEEPQGKAIVCHYDPVSSQTSGISFKLEDFCLKCCTHLLYDGLLVDSHAKLTLRDSSLAREMASWHTAQTNASRGSFPQLIVGLRSEPPTSFATISVSSRTLIRLHESLLKHYGHWQGVAVLWDDVTGITPLIHKSFFVDLHESAKPTSFKVFAYITPEGIHTRVYDYSALEEHTTGVMVETHEFAIPGRAYPPCSFEAVEGMASSEKQNWVFVINEVVSRKSGIASKLIPTVSTLGKKYKLSDPAQRDIGDLVSGRAAAIPISEICANHSSWSVRLDTSTKCLYGYNSVGQWIGFEGKDSVVFKAELIKKRKFLGLALMNVEMDDDNNCNATVKNYLLSCIHANFML